MLTPNLYETPPNIVDLARRLKFNYSIINPTICLYKVITGTVLLVWIPCHSAVPSKQLLNETATYDSYDGMSALIQNDDLASSIKYCNCCRSIII